MATEKHQGPLAVGPNVSLAHGHLVKVLCNLASRPTSGIKTAFNDVPKGMADAVARAA